MYWRVPTGVLQDVALDDRRDEAVVVAHADVRTEHAVVAGQPAGLGQKLVLGKRRRQVERRGRTDGSRDGLADQLVERAGAHHLEHRDQIGVVGADVALQKRSSVGFEWGRHLAFVFL